MQVVHDPERRVAPERGTAVTIGAYDGVHLGHQALLRRLRTRADQQGLATALVTFDRHPAQVVRPESAPQLLTTLEQKLELLAATGLLDLVCVLTFDDRRRHESADEFVHDVLVDTLGAQLVVVGADFHFGYQRRGNVPFLREAGERWGFAVEAVDLVPVEGGDHGMAYSSTLIRGLLVAGDVRLAARLLGRPHEVRGPVVEGDRRGRELGFPTANVEVVPEICLPAEGIYAGYLLEAGTGPRPAAISLGRRPTFHDPGSPPVLEVHVIGFEGDLYGREVSVQFVERLRGEEHFASVEALVEQMRRDVEAARRILT